MQGCIYLLKCGHLLLSTNFTTRYGEIDIISFYNNCFHFVEVKAWKNVSIDPIFSLNSKKRQRMKQVAREFLLNLHQKKVAPAFRLPDIFNRNPWDISMSFDLLIVRQQYVEYRPGLF